MYKLLVFIFSLLLSILSYFILLTKLNYMIMIVYYVCAGLCQMSGVCPGQGDGGIRRTRPLHRVLRRGQSGGSHCQ